MTDEWLTPPHIIDALGNFDLDPCAPVRRPWPMAAEHYTILDNGLMLPWKGRVWMNPPYGRDTEKWLARLSWHEDGIALIFARTDTDAFHRYVFRKAHGILFIQGRLRFCDTAGLPRKQNAPYPSCLVAYGIDNFRALKTSKIPGKVVKL